MNRTVRLMASCLPALAVLLIITLFFLEVAPYRIIGDNLIPSPSRPTGASEIIRLTGGNTGTRTWKYTLPELDRLHPLGLLVRVRMQSESLRRGSRKWMVGRADFIFRDGSGRSVPNADYTIATAKGSQDWRSCARFLPIPSSAVAGQLVLENAGSSGTLRCTDPAVYPAVPKVSFARWRFFLLCLWSATFLFYQYRLRLWKRPDGGWLLLVIGLIVMGAVLPERWLDQWLGGPIRSTLDPTVVNVRFPAGNGWEQAGITSFVDMIKNWGHFLLFALLSASSLRSFTGRTDRTTRPPAPVIVSVLVYLLLFAAATEILQFFVPSRSVSMQDWAIDAAGILSGLAAWSISRRFDAHRRRIGERRGWNA